MRKCAQKEKKIKSGINKQVGMERPTISEFKRADSSRVKQFKKNKLCQ